MAKLSEYQMTLLDKVRFWNKVDFVLDSASPRPRIRLEVGTWYECEIMPPDTFFELCHRYWENRESVG